MAQPTYAQARSLLGGGGLASETLHERFLSVLAMIASGQNPDGSAFALGTSGTIASEVEVKNDSGNPIPVSQTGINLEVPFTTTTVQAVGTTDVSNYKSVAVQVVSQGTNSTVTFQVSNDNINWSIIALAPASAIGSKAVASSTSTGVWVGTLGARYFRLNVTGISAGTTAGVIEFSALPVPASTVTSALASGNTGPQKTEDGATADGDAGVGILGVRRDLLIANASVSADGDYLFPFHDNFGALWVADRGNSFANIAANATTVAKASAGILHSLVINTKGVTSQVVIFDNTAGSGTKIATIDTTLSTTAFLYDVQFSTGLTLVTTGGTPADITVTFR